MKPKQANEPSPAMNSSTNNCTCDKIAKPVENGWKTSCPCNLLLGLAAGMVLSTAGFHFWMQLMETRAAQMTTAHVLYFSVLWSTSTYLITYRLFFPFWHKTHQKSKPDSNDIQMDRVERYFAVGFISGFCLAYGINDIMYGMPARTSLIAAGTWITSVGAIRYCFLDQNDGENDQQEETIEDVVDTNHDHLRRRLLDHEDV